MGLPWSNFSLNFNVSRQQLTNVEVLRKFWSHDGLNYKHNK